MPIRIDREQVQQLTADGAQLLEVLGRDEYREAHLPGALNIPLDELTPSAVESLDRHRPVITYCYDTQCDMSPRAAWRLESLGFDRVYHYAPGKADWMGAGLRIEGEAASMPTIGGLAHRAVPTCALDTPLDELNELLQRSGSESCFVVNDAGVLLGRVYRSRLAAAATKTPGTPVTAEQLMDPGPSTYRPDVTALEMAQRMKESELTNAPVTSSDGRLVGIVLRSDVEAAAQASPDVRRTETNPAARSH